MLWPTTVPCQLGAMCEIRPRSTPGVAKKYRDGAKQTNRAVRRALIIRHGCGGLHEFSELRALILRLRCVYLMTSLCSYIIHSLTRVVLTTQLKQSDDVASAMAKGNVGTVSVYASNTLSYKSCIKLNNYLDEFRLCKRKYKIKAIGII